MGLSKEDKLDVAEIAAEIVGAAIAKAMYPPPPTAEQLMQRQREALVWRAGGPKQDIRELTGWIQVRDIGPGGTNVTIGKFPIRATVRWCHPGDFVSPEGVGERINAGPRVQETIVTDETQALDYFNAEFDRENREEIAQAETTSEIEGVAKKRKEWLRRQLYPRFRRNVALDCNDKSLSQLEGIVEWDDPQSAAAQ